MITIIAITMTMYYEITITMHWLRDSIAFWKSICEYNIDTVTYNWAPLLTQLQDAICLQQC